MSQIVCVSCVRWEERPQRLANLLERLEGVEALVFEPAVPAFSSLRRPREGKRLADHVTAYTLPAAITWREDTLPRFERLSQRNARFIQARMAEHGFRSPLLWLTGPGDVALPDQVDHYGLVYDCDREWLEAPADWTRSLCETADVVFVTSPALEERLNSFYSNAALIPNGVDYPLFSQAAGQYDRLPADLEQLSGPVLGYLGEVGDFTQLEPVRLCAVSHPEWSFAFVGRFSRRNPSFGALRRLSNVHLLGEKSWTTLPRYLSRFDVCLEVGSERRENPHIVSERVYQYLASGKPIAAMTEEEAPYCANLIHYVRDAADFETACRRALADREEGRSWLRSACAQKADWQRRASQVQHILETNGFL